ncbi:MAG TPA: PhnD/SsuA/transferrin family substrate-binding protein [Gammaproteobacteria bacterium]
MSRSWPLLCLCLFVVSLGARADDPESIVFATAPTHSEEETIRIYTPLMRHLSRATGKPFVLKTARNFVEYSLQMRQDNYDMVFDGPHLSGWRMDNLGHTPIVRLPGTIRIVVVTRDEVEITSLEELQLGREKVCAFNSPNMLTMAFLSHFPNPVRQPTMLRVQGFDSLMTCLRSKQGDVAVLRDKLWNKLDKEGLKLVAAPQRGYPERTFTVGSRVSPELRQKIQQALLSEEGVKASQAILERFKKDKLIGASASEYEGLGALLSPVWGFHAMR